MNPNPPKSGPTNPPANPLTAGVTLSGSGTFTILVTDDDPGSRKSLASLLRDRGFATLEAASASLSTTAVATTAAALTTAAAALWTKDEVLLANVLGLFTSFLFTVL